MLSNSFCVFNFHGSGQPRKYFDSENFQIYGIKIICLFLHLTGKYFELDSNPVQAELTQSMTAVQLDGVQINYLDSREGNESFVMEITNVTFLPTQGQTLSLDPGFDKNLSIHGILNQTEVVIVDNSGMLHVHVYDFHVYVYTNVYVCMYVCACMLVCLYLYVCMLVQGFV